MPAFLANSSSLMGSSAIPFRAGRSGEALLVDGSDGSSMSIKMEDRLRKAGSSGNIDRRVDVGLDGTDLLVNCVSEAYDASGTCREVVDGLSNDHERTRSRAST